MTFKRIATKNKISKLLQSIKNDFEENIQCYVTPKKISAKLLKSKIKIKINNGDLDTWEFESNLKSKIIHKPSSNQDWSKNGYLTLNVHSEFLEVEFHKSNSYTPNSKSHILGRFTGALLSNFGDTIESILILNSEQKIKNT